MTDHSGPSDRQLRADLVLKLMEMGYDADTAIPEADKIFSFVVDGKVAVDDRRPRLLRAVVTSPAPVETVQTEGSAPADAGIGTDIDTPTKRGRKPMALPAKPCAVCGVEMTRGDMTARDFRRRKSCSLACAAKLKWSRVHDALELKTCAREGCEEKVKKNAHSIRSYRQKALYCSLKCSGIVAGEKKTARTASAEPERICTRPGCTRAIAKLPTESWHHHRRKRYCGSACADAMRGADRARKKQGLPPPSPVVMGPPPVAVVAGVSRQDELDAINRFMATNSVTACPPKFLAPVEGAVAEAQIREKLKTITLPVDTGMAARNNAQAVQAKRRAMLANAGVRPPTGPAR